MRNIQVLGGLILTLLLAHACGDSSGKGSGTDDGKTQPANSSPDSAPPQKSPGTDQPPAPVPTQTATPVVNFPTDPNASIAKRLECQTLRYTDVANRRAEVKTQGITEVLFINDTSRATKGKLEALIHYDVSGVQKTLQVLLAIESQGFSQTIATSKQGATVIDRITISESFFGGTVSGAYEKTKVERITFDSCKEI